MRPQQFLLKKRLCNAKEMKKVFACTYFPDEVKFSCVEAIRLPKREVVSANFLASNSQIR